MTRNQMSSLGSKTLELYIIIIIITKIYPNGILLLILSYTETPSLLFVYYLNYPTYRARKDLARIENIDYDKLYPVFHSTQKLSFWCTTASNFVCSNIDIFSASIKYLKRILPLQHVSFVIRFS
jgi:hypothetical protein